MEDPFKKDYWLWDIMLWVGLVASAAMLLFCVHALYQVITRLLQ